MIVTRKQQIKTAVDRFLELAKPCEDIIEIAQFGSSVTEKEEPRDFDLMVFIADNSCIPYISLCARKTSNIFHAHDVSVFDKDRKYLGRACYRKECPGTVNDCYICGLARNSPKHLMQTPGFSFKEEIAFMNAPVVLYHNPKYPENIVDVWLREFYANRYESLTKEDLLQKIEKRDKEIDSRNKELERIKNEIEKREKKIEQLNTDIERCKKEIELRKKEAEKRKKKTGQRKNDIT